MINQLNGIFGKLRPITVLVLILGFLVLGSCPLKKAIHTLVKGSIENSPATGQSFSAVVCSTAENSFSKKISLPDHPVQLSAPALIAIIAMAFGIVWGLFASMSQRYTYRESPLILNAVPPYLRNRALLI